MADSNPLLDREGDLSQVASALFSPGTVPGTLRRIVELAERAVDGCEAAGILFANGAPSALPTNSALITDLDRMQIDADEGPGLDAARHGDMFYARDLLDDARWPTFGPAAVAAGIRTVLAYPLSTDHPSALNLYARFPNAFGATDRAQGLLFATLARIALHSAQERADDAEKSLHLIEALVTRELIGQAQGILMERERITADQAFDVLRRASQRMNIKLREVAETLVETGEVPPD